MNRIAHIRDEERKYHDYCYDNYKLFEKGSWLHKPVKTVMELVSMFDGFKNVNILDLGSGVGRNSIPLAKAVKENHGKVVCVDLLDSAIEKLNEYSQKYNVEEVIETIKIDIATYYIKPKNFDFIVAVSSLEHVESEMVFEKVIQQMAEGTKEKGINCIIVNSEVEEIDIETNEKLDALMEINMRTVDMMNKLKIIYNGWEVLKVVVKPLEYKISRNNRPVLLKTNAITYVVKKW